MQQELKCSLRRIPCVTLSARVGFACYYSLIIKSFQNVLLLLFLFFNTRTLPSCLLIASAHTLQLTFTAFHFQVLNLSRRKREISVSYKPNRCMLFSKSVEILYQTTQSQPIRNQRFHARVVTPLLSH